MLTQAPRESAGFLWQEYNSRLIYSHIVLVILIGLVGFTLARSGWALAEAKLKAA